MALFEFCSLNHLHLLATLIQYIGDQFELILYLLIEEFVECAPAEQIMYIDTGLLADAVDSVFGLEDHGGRPVEFGEDDGVGRG